MQLSVHFVQPSAASNLHWDVECGAAGAHHPFSGKPGGCVWLTDEPAGAPRHKLDKPPARSGGQAGCSALWYLGAKRTITFSKIPAGCWWLLQQAKLQDKKTYLKANVGCGSKSGAHFVLAAARLLVSVHQWEHYYGWCFMRIPFKMKYFNMWKQFLGLHRQRNNSIIHFTSRLLLSWIQDLQSVHFACVIKTFQANQYVAAEIKQVVANV